MSGTGPDGRDDGYPFEGPLRFQSVIRVRAAPVLLMHHPGRNHVDPRGRRWARGLEEDLAALGGWGARCVVTLVGEAESARLGVPGYPAAVRAGGFVSFNLPVADFSVPGAAFMEAFVPVRAELDRLLDAGAPVAVHCAAGLGRTGVFAAALLVREGLAPAEAIARVRAVRPGAIETAEQEAFCARCLALWD